MDISRISVDPKTCHGKPCIKGTRVMVHQVLDLLANGMSPREITSKDYFPDITIEDAYACIAFSNQFVKNEEIHFFETYEGIIVLRLTARTQAAVHKALLNFLKKIKLEAICHSLVVIDHHTWRIHY